MTATNKPSAFAAKTATPAVATQAPANFKIDPAQPLKSGDVATLQTQGAGAEAIHDGTPLVTSAATALRDTLVDPLQLSEVESLEDKKARLQKEVAELEEMQQRAREVYQTQLSGQQAQLEAQERKEHDAALRDQRSQEQDDLDAEHLNDGVVLSQAPGQFPNQATFVSAPGSSVGFDGGRTIVFSGGRFTHNHVALVRMLRRLSKSGSGIHELQSAEQVAAETQTDELVVARKETLAEAQRANALAARNGLK